MPGRVATPPARVWPGEATLRVAVAGSTRKLPPVTPGKYRLIYGALTLALVLVAVAAFMFGSPEGDDIGLPPPIEGISPVPQETVLRQARIEVDMDIGYEIQIWVDDILLPEQEILFIEGTGVYSWSPGIDRLFFEWDRGEHRVRVRWTSVTGLPDVGEYEWTFRVF